MTPDEIKYRHCDNPGCDYRELRGSRQGAFFEGKFVCDECYWKLAEKRTNQQSRSNGE